MDLFIGLCIHTALKGENDPRSQKSPGNEIAAPDHIAIGVIQPPCVFFCSGGGEGTNSFSEVMSKTQSVFANRWRGTGLSVTLVL